MNNFNVGDLVKRTHTSISLIKDQIYKVKNVEEFSIEVEGNSYTHTYRYFELVFPAKWYIERTKDNHQVINDWFNKKINHYSYCTDYSGFITFDFTVPYVRPSLPLTEITFEQFKKYVLKEEDKKEFVLPEKWCVKRTSENYEVINDYFNKGCNINTYEAKNAYMHYPNHRTNVGFLNGNHSASNVYSGYTEITFEQFKQYVLKTTPVMDNKRKLTIQNYRKIYNVACPKWKTKLQDMYGKEFAISDEITIPEDDYKQMRIACTSEQHALFDEIFGKDKEIYPDGTPCLVSNHIFGGWFFRYADGNGFYYINGKKSGEVISHIYHQKLDINNLPVNS